MPRLSTEAKRRETAKSSTAAKSRIYWKHKKSGGSRGHPQDPVRSAPPDLPDIVESSGFRLGTLFNVKGKARDGFGEP